MQLPFRHLLGALTFISAAIAQAAPQATIVVDLGEHSSAQAAVDAADGLDWSREEAPQRISTEALAALELQHYLGKMTGAGDEAFPIVDDQAQVEGARIVLATKPAPAATPGAFTISTPTGDQPTLLLTGDDRAGTLYAAYTYLESLGVRWYGPGEVNEEVPPIGEFKIAPIERREEPDYRTRGFWAWEDRGTDDFVAWMGRNRMNFWTVSDSRRIQLKLRGIKLTCGGHLHQTKFMHPEMEYPYDVAQFTGDEGKPNDPYKAGDYKGDLNSDGKVSYGEVHPEWYGLRDGKRSFNMQTDFGDNICTSNPDPVHELMIRVVQDLIDGEWRYADSINFWMLDGGKWCQCAECAALGSQTDRNLLVIHELSKELDRARAEGRLGREIGIEFLSYADVIEPPTKPLPADFNYERCVATFFPIQRCYVHTFADPTCTEYNAEYFKHYNGWFVEPDRHYRGQVFIGEYYNVSRFNHLPLVLDRTMRVDIPEFHRTGARQFHYMHAPVANWGVRTLTQWLEARLLWDVEADVDALLDDYFTGRYGPAAGAMREVYGDLQTAYENSAAFRYTMQGPLNRGDAKIFTRKHLQFEETHPETDDGQDWEQIMAALADSRRRLDEVKAMDLPADVKARVAEDDDLCAYGEKIMHFTDRLTRGRLALAAGKRDEAKALHDEAAALAAELKQDTHNTQFGSSHVNAENGLAASRLEPALKKLGEDLK